MCTGVEVDAFSVVCFEVVICSGFTLFVDKSGVKLQLANCLQNSDSHLQISPKTWWRLSFSWKLTFWLPMCLFNCDDSDISLHSSPGSALWVLDHSSCTHSIIGLDHSLL